MRKIIIASLFFVFASIFVADAASQEEWNMRHELQRQRHERQRQMNEALAIAESVDMNNRAENALYNFLGSNKDHASAIRMLNEATPPALRGSPMYQAWKNVIDSQYGKASLPSNGGQPIFGNVGSFNGGMQQNQQMVQVASQINNLLLSDMNPQFRGQLQQAIMQIGIQNAHNTQQLVQALFLAANQLSGQSGDDNQRGALSLLMTATVLQGGTLEQLVAFLNTVISNADQKGQTWHRRGNFGAFVNQATR